MEPNERIDIERFDAWLDQLAKGTGSPAPADATDLAQTAMWLRKKVHLTKTSTQFEQQLQTQLQTGLAGRPDAPLSEFQSHTAASKPEISAVPRSSLMAAAAVVLIGLPALFLFFRSFSGGSEDAAIPAPLNNLAQSDKAAACSVEQSVLLTITGSPEHEAILIPNTWSNLANVPTVLGVPAIVEDNLPTGLAAEGSDLAEIVRTLDTLAACISIGDFASADSLHSDDSFRRAGSIRKIGQIATPTSRDFPAEFVTPSILTSNMLPDGRIGVLIERDLWGYGLKQYFVFVDSPRGWLVDEEMLVAPNENVASPNALTTVTIIATELRFTPSLLVIPADNDITLTIINEGVIPHSFAIPEFHIEVRVEPGRSEDVTVNLPAGTYEFRSTVANQGGLMFGTLTVE